MESSNETIAHYRNPDHDRWSSLSKDIHMYAFMFMLLGTLICLLLFVLSALGYLSWVTFLRIFLLNQAIYLTALGISYVYSKKARAFPGRWISRIEEGELEVNWLGSRVYLNSYRRLKRLYFMGPYETWCYEEDIQRLFSSGQEGDEVWQFNNGRFHRMMGLSGIALVRNGKVINYIVHAMN